jgi:hypothetical protein
VVDFSALGPRNSLPFETAADSPGEIGQAFDPRQGERLLVVVDEKEPVAPPGDVAMHEAVTGDFHRHLAGVPPAGNILNGRRLGPIVVDGDHSHGGVDAMLSATDPTEVSEGDREPNHPVPAHVEHADVVEENHSGSTGGIGRFAEQGPHQDIRAAGLVDHRRAEPVMLIPKAQSSLGERTGPQVGSATHDDTGRFSPRV